MCNSELEGGKIMVAISSRVEYRVSIISVVMGSVGYER